MNVSEKMIEVTAASFDSDVLKSEQPVLVDFWAEWCQPCKMLSPIVEQIANDYEGKLKVAKIDADQHQEILIKYGVMGLPTLMLFKGGEPVTAISGFKPKDNILSKLLPHIG
jgi:thioredoxin 1